MKKTILSAVVVTLLVALLHDGIMAQEGLPDPAAIAGQNLRGYTHMFIAYFIAWGLILGWAISIARRLGKVERALVD